MEEIYKNLSLENLENEIWRNIEGYECLYQVSSYGRVKSLRDNKGNYREKILKQGKMKNGYLLVTLCKEGKLKSFRVHRLVANAFIENTNNFKCVNHIDENKTNNCADNLEWCTYSYNNNYGLRTAKAVASTDWKSVGRKVAEKLTNGVRSKQVFQYTKNGTLVAVYPSVAECGRQGFDHSHVASCCNGDRKQHRGYMWSYYPL